MESELEIGLIVPVLDDARALKRLLEWCSTERIPGSHIWVVDGGSSDDSMKIAHHFGANAISVQPPRAAQMNEGARAARAAGCDVLWFVHADALPPSGAMVRIASAIGDGAVGGAFRRRFELRSRFLRATCVLADWRGAACGWFVGDQAIFATAQAFNMVDEFPP